MARDFTISLPVLRFLRLPFVCICIRAGLSVDALKRGVDLAFKV